MNEQRRPLSDKAAALVTGLSAIARSLSKPGSSAQMGPPTVADALTDVARQLGRIADGLEALARSQRVDG